MMKRIFKIILVIPVILLGVVFLIKPAQAQIDELVVEFERTPLFEEANFLPGQSVSRWIKVTNNSGQPQRIAVEAMNVSDIDALGQVLNLEIKEGSEVRYANTLADFFAAGEVYLSDLVTGAAAQYDFAVGFVSGAEGPQGAGLGFDMLVGYQGVEGGLLPGEGSGGDGGGGGGLPPGLTIKYAKAIYLATTTAIITWLTSYSATSQVVYDTLPGTFNLDASTGGGPPKYGYVYSKEGDDSGLEKMTFHSVTLTGLLPNTVYYYRCISHASPSTISQEYSFTTLMADLAAESIAEQEIKEEIREEVIEEEKKEVIAPFEEIREEEEIKEEFEEEVVLPGPSNNILAAIGSFGSVLGGWLIVLGLFLLALWILFIIRRRKKRAA